MMHGLAEIPETKLNEEIILKIKTSNPHLRDDKGLTYSHLAAKHCMPDVALWMYYAGPLPSSAVITDEKTPAQIAEMHGHTFMAQLLFPESNSVYEHAILLWMLKNKHGPFDNALKNLLSKIFGEPVNFIKQIRSKKDVMPPSLESMLVNNDLYIKALEDYYNAFIQSVRKSSIIAIDSLSALLFLVSNSKNIIEIALLLLQKKKFVLLKMWMITNDIHPYQVISQIQDESTIKEFISKVWAKQGILEYTINQILSEPEKSMHATFFIHIPKSDKAVFKTLLKCLADKSSDPECTRIIKEILNNPSDSPSKCVEKFQTTSPDSEGYISPNLAAYLNKYFKKLNLTVCIGQPTTRQPLRDETIMQILGFAKLKTTRKDDSDETDETKDKAEYEGQASMPSMLSTRGRSALASTSAHLFHLVHRTPKNSAVIQSKRAELDAEIQKQKTRLNETSAQLEGIRELLDQLDHEQDEKSSCQHRKWPLVTCKCNLLFSALVAFCGYETKVCIDHQTSAIASLKNLTVTIANITASCYDYFFNQACRGNFTHTVCENPCNDYATNKENGESYLIMTIVFGSVIVLPLWVLSCVSFSPVIEQGPERLEQVVLSSYSTELQNKVNAVLELADTNLTAGVIRHEADRRLENLGQQQRQLEKALQHLSAKRSLLSKRYQLFSQVSQNLRRSQVDSGIGIGLSLQEHREENLASDSTQITIMPASHISDELAVPLLDPASRETVDRYDRSLKCIIL